MMEASPGGMPAAIPKNWNRNWPANSVRPTAAIAAHGARGRATKSTGAAAIAKRATASCGGESSSSPIRVATKARPQSTATSSARRTSRALTPGPLADLRVVLADRRRRPADGRTRAVERERQADQRVVVTGNLLHDTERVGLRRGRRVRQRVDDRARHASRLQAIDPLTLAGGGEDPRDLRQQRGLVRHARGIGR